MQSRPAARWIILDPAGRVLLFRFDVRQGALAGKVFWATPGGALEPGETFSEAARRELLEETDLAVEDPGECVHTCEVVFQNFDGHYVSAEERYFLLRAVFFHPGQESWTELEHQVISAHRWWSTEELDATAEAVFPAGLAAIVHGLAHRGEAGALPSAPKSVTV